MYICGHQDSRGKKLSCVVVCRIQILNMEDAMSCTLDPRSKRSTGGGRSSRGGGKEARVEARRSERQSRRLQVDFAR